MATNDIPKSTSENITDVSSNADPLGSTADINIVQHRLDADQYMADDLDGITENLAGSGNLNFMMLQSRQNDLMSGSDGFENTSDNTQIDAIANSLAAAATQKTIDNQIDEPETYLAAKESILDLPDSLKTVGEDIKKPISENPTQETGDQLNQDINISSIIDSNNNVTIHNPKPPTGDPEDPDTPTDDIDIAVHNDIGLPDIDINLDPIEDILGDIDIIADITHGDDGINVDVDTILANLPIVSGNINAELPLATDLVNNILDGNGSVLPDTLDLADTLLNQLGSAPDANDTDLTFLNNTGLPNVDVILDPIENIVGDIDIGLGLGIDDDGLDLGIDLTLAGVELADIDITDVDIPLVMPIVNEILEAVTPVLEGILPDITTDDVPLLAEVTDLADDLTSGLLGDENGTVLDDLTDGLADPVADIADTILGGDDNPLTDVTDTVENVIVGITDTILDDGEGLIGNVIENTEDLANTLMNVLDGNTEDPGGDIADSVENLTGDLLNDLLLGDDGADTDLALFNDTDIIPDIEVNLDVIENIVGDIDVVADLGVVDGLDLGLDTVLADIPILDVDIPILGDLGGGDALWPQNDVTGIGSDVGDMDLGDLVGGVMDIASNLPDPIGSITEGLGLLDTPDDSGHGLFGGGGLFG